MSMFSDYVKERAGRRTLETEKGFMIYEIKPPECFIHDAYVMPEHRLSGEGARMLVAIEEIAKEHGCSKMTCTVSPGAKGSTNALKAVLASGFKLTASVQNLIAFAKEI